MKHTRSLVVKSVAILFCLVSMLMIIPAAQAIELKQMQTMEVSVNRLNVRANPENNDVPIYATLKKGDQVVLIGEVGRWSLVRWYEGNIEHHGYAQSRYLKTCGEPLYYAKEQVNIRSGPGTANKIVSVLNAGDSVVFVQKIGNWVKVECNGQIGYVYGKYLSEGRIDSYLGSPIALTIGRRNLKSIEYTFLKGLGRSRLTTNKKEPEAIISVLYRLKTDLKGNSIYINEYKYATVEEAKLVKEYIMEQEPFPEWLTIYFQKENCIVGYYYWFGERWTKREGKLVEDILAELTVLYGDKIPKKC